MWTYRYDMCSVIFVDIEKNQRNHTLEGIKGARAQKIGLKSTYLKI